MSTKEPTKQRIFIQEARALLQPSEVRPGMPNWFRLAVLRAFGPLPNGTAHWAVADFLRRGFGLHLDHVGRCLYRGKDSFVSEPYGVELADVQQVAELAAAIGCKWEISPNSWHFPGNTLRVVFFQQEADDQQERKATPS